MAALRIPMCTFSHFKHLKRQNLQINCLKLLSTNVDNDVNTNKSKLSGFAKAFMKQQEQPQVAVDVEQTFSTLMRNSKFIDLGLADGKIVTGKIYHVVDNDLYIDFGWKFHTVCTKPVKNSDDYVTGATVRLRIKDLELSSRFLGSKNDVLLLEADCTLLGLINSPNKKIYTQK